MSSDWYSRDGSHTIEIDSQEFKDLQWGGKAPVAKTTLDNENEVSTVFLSLDHSYGDGPPLIFETMVFGGKYDQECERYSTEAEALAGHERWVEKAGEPISEDVALLRDLIDSSDSYGNSIRLAEYLIAHGVQACGSVGPDHG